MQMIRTRRKTLIPDASNWILYSNARCKRLTALLLHNKSMGNVEGVCTDKNTRIGGEIETVYPALVNPESLRQGAVSVRDTYSPVG